MPSPQEYRKTPSRHFDNPLPLLALVGLAAIAFFGILTSLAGNSLTVFFRVFVPFYILNIFYQYLLSPDDIVEPTAEHPHPSVISRS